MTEREREALMRLTMCARNECVMCKYKDSCDSDVRLEFATKHMNILADALRKTENSSEIPNNCEHITEDGVTCAKYPACDDCLDNPLNKVKGSERLVKGSEKPNNCDTCKHYGKWENEYEYGYPCPCIRCINRCVSHYEPKTENSSEIPNNCEHITEDGVTCAKYPACDDCLDNPLNKVKGSERLVKGSEQTDCQTCKWWSSYGYCVHRECKGYEPQIDKDINVRSKDEPQTERSE